MLATGGRVNIKDLKIKYSRKRNNGKQFELLQHSCFRGVWFGSAMTSSTAHDPTRKLQGKFRTSSQSSILYRYLLCSQQCLQDNTLYNYRILELFLFFFSDSFVISNGYARSFCCYLEFHRWFRHYIFCLLFCGYSFNQPLQFLTLSWDFQWLLHTLLKSLKILFGFIQIFKSLLRILKNSSRFQCPLKNSWGFHLLWLKNIIHKLINIAECSLTIVIEFFKAKVNGLWVHRGP